MTNTIKSPGSLTLGADLDNLSVGVYQITGVKINVLGTAVTIWGTIIVCRRAFDYQQVILSNGTKAIYYRSKNESEAWTEWKQLVTNTDLQVKRYDVPQPSTNNIFTYIDTWGCVIFKTGKVVTVRINFSGSMIANSGYNTISTLPTDYRPIITILENYISPSSNNMEILINSNGQLQFFNHNEKIERDWICRKTITYVVDN